jgi:hypothetical protein
MSSKGAKKEETKPQAAKVTTATGEVGLIEDITKKQAYKKFAYRGEDLTKLINTNIDDLS